MLRPRFVAAAAVTVAATFLFLHVLMGAREGAPLGPIPGRELPLIFVGGMPRSGTTLMRVMLDAHQDVRCGQETRVIPELLSKHQEWMESEKERARLDQAGVTTLVLDNAIASVCLQVILYHGEPARRLCTKDPFLMTHGSYVRQLFPNGKFLFMIRDGRAAVHSMITRKVTVTGFNLTSYRTSLENWSAAVEDMYDQCRELGPSQCLPVRYEALVLAPEPTLRGVLRWLELPWSSSVLHHERYLLRPHGVPLSLTERSTDQVVRPVNQDALYTWVGHIPADVVADMATVAPMLAKLGYDPAANPPDYRQLLNTSVLQWCHLVAANNGDVSSFQLLARLSFPTVETKPYNMPNAKEIDPKQSFADEKYEKLSQYYGHLSARMREPQTPSERQKTLETAQQELFAFVDTHIKDLKRLLFATDMALMSMVLLKVNKRMDTSEAKIKSTQAKIPFGLYTSPEFKCLGTSYYIASAHNQEDAQMILSSERKPHCYTFRGSFSFIGFYHRHSEATYIGPHAEEFQAKDPTQGLYCHSDDSYSDAQCIYKINPREEFPESVEYEPKVSYYCGPYRYFIPATTDIRCVFSIFSMNFVLRFAYDGVTYKSSDLTFMYQNGQVFYTDEPWAGMSCWNWACKWRHNQNQRSNEFFVS